MKLSCVFIGKGVPLHEITEKKGESWKYIMSGLEATQPISQLPHLGDEQTEAWLTSLMYSQQRWEASLLVPPPILVPLLQNLA